MAMRLLKYFKIFLRSWGVLYVRMTTKREAFHIARGVEQHMLGAIYWGCWARAWRCNAVSSALRAGSTMDLHTSKHLVLASKKKYFKKTI